MDLAAAAWPDLERSVPRVLLVPMGATEQHGPHLPLGTDTIIATALAEAAAGACPAVAVAPTVAYGSSGEHADFPGTLSLGHHALELLVLELARSADDFDAIVFASWHGGNADPLSRAVSRLGAEGRHVRRWRPRIYGADLHAGRTETSLMLAIDPDLVRVDRPTGPTDHLEALLPALRGSGVRALSRTGVLGDARGATVAEGRELFAHLVADLRALLDELTRVPA